jgi:hypothetical protein
MMSPIIEVFFFLVMCIGIWDEIKKHKEHNHA